MPCNVHTVSTAAGAADSSLDPVHINDQHMQSPRHSPEPVDRNRSRTVQYEGPRSPEPFDDNRSPTVEYDRARSLEPPDLTRSPTIPYLRTDRHTPEPTDLQEPWREKTLEVTDSDDEEPDGRNANGYHTLSIHNIPFSDQGQYNTCWTHAVATCVWYKLRQQYGLRLTPSKDFIICTIMTHCNGYDARNATRFLNDVHRVLFQDDPKPIFFPVSDGYIKIRVTYKTIPTYEDAVYRLRQNEPVLVSADKDGVRECHALCAISVGVGDKQGYLQAYHDWKDETQTLVSKFREKDAFWYHRGFVLTVRIEQVFDAQFKPLKDVLKHALGSGPLPWLTAKLPPDPNTDDAVHDMGKRKREDDQ